MSRKTALWFLFGIVMCGVLLRSYQLTARSLWFDESFSWRLIQFPFQEMIARAAADVHPPLYYIILRVWAKVFSPSLLSLRAFSVTLSAVTIAAAYLFTASTFRSRRAGLFSAVLIAVSGWQIAFAWEARMYTLGTALALLSSWLLVRAVRRPSFATWIYYAIATTLFAYTHYFAFFTLAAHALVIVGYIVVKARGRIGEILHSRIFWLAGLAGALVLLLYAPWIPVFLQQNKQVQVSFWVPPVGAWSIPDTFYRFLLPTALAPPHTWPVAALTLIPMIATVLVWLMLVSYRRFAFESWLVALTGSLPVAAAIATSYLGQSLYQDRFLVFANIFILIGVAVVLSRLRPRRLANIASFFLVVLLLGTSVRYWHELDIKNRPGVRGAVEFVAGQHSKGEPIIVGSSFIFFPVDYYIRAARLDSAKLLTASSDLIHFAGGPIITASDTVSPDQAFTPTAARLWLLDTTGFGGSLSPIPSPWTVVSRQTYPEVFPHQGDIIVTELRRR